VSVLLSHIARKPFPTRQDSEELGIVEQSLEILTVMEECTVARKIREYAREVVTLLRSDSDATDPPQSHRYPAVAQSTAFADFNNLLSAHGAELDHSFSGFNFYDGGFATLQADMENPHGLGNIESFEPNGWVD
jgi:hypothetical protein